MKPTIHRHKQYDGDEDFYYEETEVDEATYLAIFGAEAAANEPGASGKGGNHLGPLSPSHNSDGLSSGQSFASSSPATSPVCSNDSSSSSAGSSGAACFQVAGLGLATNTNHHHHHHHHQATTSSAGNLYASSIDWMHFLADHSQLASSTGGAGGAKWLVNGAPVQHQQVYYQTGGFTDGRSHQRTAPRGRPPKAAKRQQSYTNNHHQQPPSNLNHRQQQNQRHLQQQQQQFVSSPWSSSSSSSAAAAALQFSMQLSGSSPPTSMPSAACDLSGRSRATFGGSTGTIRSTTNTDHDYISQQVAFGCAQASEALKQPPSQVKGCRGGRAKRTSRRPAHLDDDYVGPTNPASKKSAAKQQQQQQQQQRGRKQHCDQQIDLSKSNNNNLPNTTTTTTTTTKATSNHLKHNLSQQFFQYYDDNNKHFTSHQQQNNNDNNDSSTLNGIIGLNSTNIRSLNNLQATTSPIDGDGDGNGSTQFGLNMISKKSTSGLKKTPVQKAALTSSSPAGRRARRENRKCRKVYGMEKRELWCTQCKWKKACSRFCDDQ